MIAETDAAYIAGLFDGEGSIHMRRGIERKKRHQTLHYNQLKVCIQL